MGFKASKDSKVTKVQKKKLSEKAPASKKVTKKKVTDKTPTAKKVTKKKVTKKSEVDEVLS